MPRPRKPRGRQAPRLPGPRVSIAEKEWFVGEVKRLGTNAVNFMRDRIFATMPGYKG